MTAAGQGSPPLSIDVSVGTAYSHGGAERAIGYGGSSVPRVGIRSPVWRGRRMDLLVGADVEHMIGGNRNTICLVSTTGDCTNQAKPDLTGWVGAAEMRMKLDTGIVLGVGVGAGRYTTHQSVWTGPTTTSRALMGEVNLGFQIVHHVLLFASGRLVNVPPAAASPIGVLAIGVRLQ